MRKIICLTLLFLTTTLFISSTIYGQQCYSNMYGVLPTTSGNDVTLELVNACHPQCPVFMYAIYRLEYNNGNYVGYTLLENQLIADYNPQNYYTDENVPSGTYIYCVRFTTSDLQSFWRASSTVVIGSLTSPIIWTDKIGVSEAGTSSTHGKTLTRNINSAWDCNSGAASVNMIPSGQNGWVEMTVVENWSKKFFGLSAYNPDACRWTIFYNIYFSGSKLRIIENGTHKGHYANCSYGDVIRVERIGNRVYAKKNGTIFYTFPTSSYSSLIADVSIKDKNGKIAGGLCSHSAGSNKVTNTNFTKELEVKETDLLAIMKIVDEDLSNSITKNNHFVIKDMEVYPNPIASNGTLQVQFDSHTAEETATIRIFSMAGQQMNYETMSLHKGRNTWSTQLDNYPIGVYLLQLKTNEQTITKKIIVQ